MKKGASKSSTSEDNSFGVASVILGIFSILLASPPIYGIALGIIALIFSKKQNKVQPNKWSKAGKNLAVIGIILSIILGIALVWLAKNPEYLASLNQGIY